MSRQRNTENYVSKEALLSEIEKFQEALRAAEALGLPKPRMPDTIGKAIKDTTEGIASRPNFRGYTFIEEMKGDAIHDCIRSVAKFDTTHAKKNPFGYFSRCIWFAFLGRIDIEKKEQQAKIASMFDPNTDSWTSIDGDKTDYSGSSKAELLDFYYGNKL